MNDQNVDAINKLISDHPEVTIDRDQIRMARVGLGWTAQELADRSHLGVATIRRAESAADVPSVSEGNLYLIQRTLELAGIVFLEEHPVSQGGGRGVRLPKTERQV